MCHFNRPIRQLLAPHFFLNLQNSFSCSKSREMGDFCQQKITYRGNNLLEWPLFHITIYHGPYKSYFAEFSFIYFVISVMLMKMKFSEMRSTTRLDSSLQYSKYPWPTFISLQESHMTTFFYKKKNSFLPSSIYQY